ncbi:MAG: thioredoxin domain-containing protein, partial [Myxococcota bacterium]
MPEALAKKISLELASRPADYEPRTHNLRADGSALFTNRLILEPSPYLQQHAHNPVNWHPWGDEAFETASKLGRPVLISIGYSTCHWCHVMEEESFDDIETARLLNENFIAVKVDREARPDVDAVYMAAVHSMGKRGGWPLNVWLTPDRKPFFGGTYFPPVARGGRPSFRDTLKNIARTWSTERPRLEAMGGRLTQRLTTALAGQRAEASRIPEPNLLVRARDQAVARIDPTWGGIGG